MTAELKLAVENLYDVFSIYPGNPDMCVSPLKGTPEEMNTPLFSKPLRDLSSNELSHFSADLIYTWGEEKDLKHFLPRILELTATLDCPAFDVEVFFNKLDLTDWHTWSEDEQKAIHEFLFAHWKDLLVNESGSLNYSMFQEHFGAIVKFYPRLQDLLDVWENTDHPVATQLLAEMIYEEFSWVFSGELKCFDHTIIQVPELVVWLISEKNIKRLTDAFFTYHTDETFAEIYSFAVRTLEFEKSRRLS